MAGGYVKLHRALLDAEQMSDDWLCRLWIWCLLRANFSAQVFRGQTVLPGQLICGRVTSAAELRVSPSKWYRGIERLTEMGCITTEANSNWTTLTICNWETYQNDDLESEQPADSKRTASGQPVIQRADSQRTAGDTTSGQDIRKKESKKERMEEYKPPSPKPAKPDLLSDLEIPDCLQTESFSIAWASWVQHRKEIKKPLTPTQAGKQIAEFAKWGEREAIAAIDHTVTKGWQGIVRPTSGGTGRTLLSGIDDMRDLREPQERPDENVFESR